MRSPAAVVLAFLCAAVNAPRGEAIADARAPETAVRALLDELEVQALCPDAALARGRWRLALADGAQPNGLFTLLVRRIA